ncbi:MAG TPA: MerR family transcriptional regulator [Polyangiaceae bacterium]|nr:MerR family transcriptional regulator [Polyangiaceae bacterium]
MRIGEVAERLGVRTSTIRFYEKRGLLPEPARIGGKRSYGAEVLRRLHLIDICQKGGFSLAEIETLLRHFDAEETELAQALLLKKIAELDAIVERAKCVREVLLESFACGAGAGGLEGPASELRPRPVSEALAGDVRGIELRTFDARGALEARGLEPRGVHDTRGTIDLRRGVDLVNTAIEFREEGRAEG